MALLFVFLPIVAVSDWLIVAYGIFANDDSDWSNQKQKTFPHQVCPRPKLQSKKLSRFTQIHSQGFHPKKWHDVINPCLRQNTDYSHGILLSINKKSLTLFFFHQNKKNHKVILEWHHKVKESKDFLKQKGKQKSF